MIAGSSRRSSSDESSPARLRLGESCTARRRAELTSFSRLAGRNRGAAERRTIKLVKVLRLGFEGRQAFASQQFSLRIISRKSPGSSARSEPDPRPAQNSSRPPSSPLADYLPELDIAIEALLDHTHRQDSEALANVTREVSRSIAHLHGTMRVAKACDDEIHTELLSGMVDLRRELQVLPERILATARRESSRSITFLERG